MKIAYITQYDSSNVHAWSGSGFWIRRALEETGADVLPIGPLDEGVYLRWKTRLKKLYYLKVRGQEFCRDRELGLVEAWERESRRQLDRREVDVLFSPGTLPLAYSQSPLPKVFWTDTCFAGHMEMYRQFDAWSRKNLKPEELAELDRTPRLRYARICRETETNANRLEQMALDKASLAIFSSQWAADRTLKYYHIDPAKVKVVPFGANIVCNRREEDILQYLELRSGERCRLLFCAVEWAWKGGSFILAIAEELHRRGVPVAVDIVGVTPPVASLPEYVKCHGFVSKRTPEGVRHFEALMQQADFLVLPTRADCAPVVLAEAGSYGVPSLATAVGGIGSQIVSGRNGWSYPLDAPASEWADRIESLFADRAAYRELALSSFRHYKEELNWETAGRRVRGLLEEVCGGSLARSGS